MCFLVLFAFAQYTVVGMAVYKSGVFFVLMTFFLFGFAVFLMSGGYAVAQESSDPPAPEESEEDDFFGSFDSDSSSSGLIINCGFGEEKDGVQDCNTLHLIELAKNAIRLLIWLSVTGAGVLIFWRGVGLAMSSRPGGNYEAELRKLKESLPVIVGGIFFVLASWLIVEIGFKIIGYTGPSIFALS